MNRGFFRWSWITIVVLLVLTGLKLWLASWVELLPEEAYYWTYWQHPALGYYDHPPMVAWVIGLGTAIAGDTELGIRLGFIVLALGGCGLMYWLAQLWFDARVATASALTLALLPIYLGTGTFAFPDEPLIFFWLLTLVAVTRAVRSGRIGWWLLAGVAFGGALLSKYTALLLAPSLGLFLLVVPAHRHWLRRWQPWVAGLVALAVFSPVVFWNAEHQWASFLFQSSRTVGQKPAWLRNVALFWLVQLLILTPVMLGLLLGAVGRAFRQRREAHWFALAFGLPLFAVFVLASFKTQIHVNWTAPAFLSLLPIVVADIVARRRWITGSVTLALCLGIAVVGFANIGWGWPKLLAYSRVGGWRELADHVEVAEHHLERLTGQTVFTIGADKYNLAAELSFYTHEPEEQVNVYAFGDQGLGFRYWTQLEEWRGHPAIVVLTKTNPRLLAELDAHFARHDPPTRVVVPTIGRRSRAVYLVNCYGYRLEDHSPL